METVNAKDRERLRSLAEKQAEYANSGKSGRLLRKGEGSCLPCGFCFLISRMKSSSQD